MKSNILSITISLAAAFSFGQSANYISFSENTHWRIDQTTNVSGPALTCSGGSHYHFFLQGDTTIASKTYKKVYRSDIYESSFTGQANCYPYPEYAESGFAGALFDDSIADIVYFIPSFSSNSTEYVLYDYTLNIGDTINSSMVLCNRIVLDVDTVTIGGIDRRRWHYTSCGGDPEFYIEGLGSSHGFIEPTGFSYMDTDLICVQQNGNTIYDSGVNSDFGCYGVFAESENQNVDFPLLEIYPNPASETVLIKGVREGTLLSITLTNQLGEQLPANYSVSDEAIRLTTSQLANGIYVVKIATATGSSSKPIVIQH